jgi:hypothetical protein
LVECQRYQSCTVANITFVVEAAGINSGALSATPSALTLDHSLPGTFLNSSGLDDGPNENAAIVSLNNFLDLNTVTITIHEHTDVSLSCRCGSRCTDTRNGGRSLMRGAIVRVSGQSQTPAVSTIVDVLINVSDAALTVNAPKTTLGITVDTFISLSGLHVILDRCVVVMESTNLDIGRASRSQALLEISTAHNTTGVNVLARDVDLTFTIENGGCSLTVSNVLSLLDSISFATIRMVNVQLVVAGVDGTAITITAVVLLTTMTSLINVAVQDPTWAQPGSNISISISDSSLTATHTTDLPQLFFIAAVFSTIAAVNVVRSLEHCSIALTNTHVLRQYPLTAGPASWLVGASTVHVNATALVSLLDVASVAIATAPSLAPFVALIFGDKSFSSVHTNVQTSITDNCTVAYDEQLVPSATDSVAFINLPTASSRCTYLIQDSWPSRHRATFGAPIGSFGDALIADSSVTVRRMSGVSMLLFAFLQPLVVRGDSQISFDNISLTARHFGLPMHSSAIGAHTANITVTPSPLRSTAVSAVFVVRRCAFTNFTSLLMSSALNVTPTAAPSVLLELGCNLWNGDALPPAAIGLNGSTAQRFVSYPAGSIYNASYRCRGFFSETATTSNKMSVSRSVGPPAAEPPSPPVPSSAITTVTTVVGVIGAAAAASGSLFDAQGLVAMGRSTCAPPSLRAATTASQFLLSPFYALGDLAMVAGNAALFLLLHGAHRLLLRRKRMQVRRQQTLSAFPPSNHLDVIANNCPAAVAATMIDLTIVPGVHEQNLGKLSPPKPAQQLHNTEQRMLKRTPSMNSKRILTPPTTVLRAEVALRFPHHSITLGLLLAPGVANGGTRELLSGSVAGAIAGTAALVMIVAGVRWRVMCGRSALMQRFRFLAYRHAAVRAAAVPWALPLGLWGPRSLRSTHGRLRGSVRPGGEWLSAQPITVSLVIQTISSIPVPESWCVGMWGCLSAVQLTAAAMMMCSRPSRAPLSDVLQVISLVAAAAIQIVAGLISVDVANLTSLLSILSLAAMLISFLKMVHTVYVILWERKYQASLSSSCHNDDTAMSTAKSERLSQARLFVVKGHRGSVENVLKYLVKAVCAASLEKTRGEYHTNSDSDRNLLRRKCAHK